MKKDKISGPSVVSCEMLSNDVCIRELCGVANDLLMEENMPGSWKSSKVVLLYKGKGNVLECSNYLNYQVAGAWNEGGGTCVREKIEKDG